MATRSTKTQGDHEQPSHADEDHSGSGDVEASDLDDHGGDRLHPGVVRRHFEQGVAREQVTRLQEVVGGSVVQQFVKAPQHAWGVHELGDIDRESHIEERNTPRSVTLG
jgi:hypothetical protein